MKVKLLGFAVALLAIATIGVVQLQTQALDSSPDCDQFAVIWCGKYSMPAVRQAYDHGSKNSPNIPKIFGTLGISRADLNAKAVNGVVYKNGQVKVGNKLVATNAKTVIRNISGGAPIAGTNAKVVNASRMGDSQTALVVLDKDGRFLYAIMKPCGNPVKATPVQKPKPQPKPAAECKNITAKKISRTKFAYTAKATTSNGAKISSYTFETIFHSKTVKTHTVKTSSKQASSNFSATEPGNYRVRVTVKTSVGNKSGANCYTDFKIAPTTPKPAAECKDLAVEKISRTKFAYTAKATTSNGATISAYTFQTSRNNTVVKTATVNTTSKQAVSDFDATEAGDYQVRVTVKTSEGNKTGANCVKNFTVTPQPETPAAECKDLAVEKISRTKFAYTAKASATNGATISAYTFETSRNNQVVKTATVNTTSTQATSDFEATEAGDYQVRVTVKTSEGNKTGANCVKNFTVTPKPVPGVSITKLVNGQKSIRTGVDVTFQYQIAVKNTGDTELKNVLVTDTPEAGVTLLSSGGSIGTITNNTWTYTIPSLAKGATMNFTLSAKVPAYQADSIKNTVCVDAPEVPGSPDDCDEATVVVPPPTPGKVEVCNPETGEIITVDESEADKYVPVDSPKCKTIKVCVIETKETKTIRKSDFDSSKHTTDFSLCETVPVVPETPVEAPTELPTTGPADTAVQLIGATSLAGALGYYLMSRRQQMQRFATLVTMSNKQKKKRNKKYAGTDARVTTPLVTKVSAEERSRAREWWLSNGRVVKFSGIALGIVAAIGLVISGIVGLFS